MKQEVANLFARLATLDLKKAEVNKFYEELDEVLGQLKEHGQLNGFYQSTDGTVYQIVKPSGRFVTFKDVDYVRTKREGEERGSLSAKAAEAAGFKVNR